MRNAVLLMCLVVFVSHAGNTAGRSRTEVIGEYLSLFGKQPAKEPAKH